MTDASTLKTDGDVDVLELRQALWDVYGTLGFDQDGDRTPAAVCDLPNVVRRAAVDATRDYEDLASEAESQAERSEALEEIRQRVADGWTAERYPDAEGALWVAPGRFPEPARVEVAAVLWPDPPATS